MVLRNRLKWDYPVHLLSNDVFFVIKVAWGKALRSIKTDHRKCEIKNVHFDLTMLLREEEDAERKSHNKGYCQGTGHFTLHCIKSA